MALGDFQTFTGYAYNSFVTTYQQNAKIFGEVTGNAIQIAVLGFSGDHNQRSAFENLASLVGNRDPASTAAATEHALKELLKVDVKVGFGTPNISYTNTAFDWTQRDPRLAGTAFGEAIAEGAMAYQLNSILTGAVSSITAADAVYDGTAATATLDSLVFGAGKFGDRQADIVCWVMHSKSMTDIYAQSIGNSNRLFEFGTVRVMDDGFGRRLVMTDSDALHFDNAGTENYHQLGLVSGGLSIQDQGDLRVYEDLDLSEENAKQLMKAEGSFGIGIKGYTFNTTVSKPNDTDLANPVNWSRVVDLGLKDTAGVKVTTL